MTAAAAPVITAVPKVKILMPCALPVGRESKRANYRNELVVAVVTDPRSGWLPSHCLAARLTAETTARSEAVVIEVAIPTPQTVRLPIEAST